MATVALRRHFDVSSPILQHKNKNASYYLFIERKQNNYIVIVWRELMHNMEYTNLDPKLNEALAKAFSGGVTKFIQVGEEKWMYPATLLENADSYKNFQTRPDDVWITGYPRSGTTLTESICWLLTHNLDFNRAKVERQDKRVPFFEIKTVNTSEQIAKCKKISDNPDEVQKFWEEASVQMEYLDSMTERRVIKSHLPYSLCPENLFSSGCKVIYLARNAKDVFVSYYHLQQSIEGRAFVGTIEEFFGYLQQDLLYFNPYWRHVKQGWERRNDKNYLFLFYEDIRKDLRGSIRKIAEFIQADLSDDQLESLVSFMEFDNFKENFNGISKQLVDTANGCQQFVRRGKIEGWKDYFNDELNDRFNKWIKENVKKVELEGVYPIPL